MNNPQLFVMVGIPSSGKSFLAKSIAEDNNAIIVSSDSIRKELFGNQKEQEHNNEVFKIFHSRIKDLLTKKQNAIADATNLTIKDRRTFFEILSKVNCDIIACVVIRRIEECILSNKNRENPVPEDVIYRMRSKFQIPFYNEGFDEVTLYYNNAKKYYTNVENHYDDFENSLKLMETFDQKTKWHTLYLKDHCDAVAKNYSDPWMVLAAKLHDIGKLFTQSIGEDGNCHYYNHAEIGAYYLLSNYKSLEKLGLSSFEILRLLVVVNYHMLPFDWKTEKSCNKWREIFGKEMYDFFVEFNLLDVKAK